jgi:hypothetical protein
MLQPIGITLPTLTSAKSLPAEPRVRPWIPVWAEAKIYPVTVAGVSGSRYKPEMVMLLPAEAAVAIVKLIERLVVDNVKEEVVTSGPATVTVGMVVVQNWKPGGGESVRLSDPITKSPGTLSSTSKVGTR